MYSKFNYRGLGKLLNINTLSPSGQYYYRIQKPYSINMSNFGSGIAFYSISKELLYHRKGCVAHWLDPFIEINYVKWSRQGNMAMFYEFKRNEIYDIVFLSFNKHISYRLNFLIDSSNDLFDSMKLVDREYDEVVVEEILKSNNVPYSNLFCDKIDKPKILDYIFKNVVWHPRV